jgi:hypothetical protein
VQKPDGLVIDNYVHRIRNPLARRTIKSIVNPAETLHVVTCHHFAYREGFAVNERMEPIAGPDFARTDSVSRELLRINHYVTRSFEDSREKRALPRADSGKPRKFGGSPPHGDVEDHTIQMFSPAVREAVARSEGRARRPCP